jgi:hypothetical protein
MMAIRVRICQLREPSSLEERPIFDIVLPDYGQTVIQTIPEHIIRQLDPNCRPLIQVDRTED